MILRILYKKIGDIKFISHLDTAKVFERAFRRGNVPLKFSLGFNPRPKMAFAAPLSVGVSSDYELVDLEIEKEFDMDSLMRDQKIYFPEGFEILSFKYLQSSKSLMSMVASAEHIIRFCVDSPVDFNVLIKKIFDSETINITKISGEGRKRTERIIDIRPHILAIDLLEHIKDPKGDQITLKMHLSAGSTFNLKPETVLEKMALDEGFSIMDNTIRIHRVMIYGDVKGKPIKMYEMS